MAKWATGRVLDVGFADIPNCFLSNCDVIGLDRQLTTRPCNYSAVVVGDVPDFPFQSASFDTILAGEIIEHLEQPMQFLREARRLLQQGGRIVISAPNPFYPPIILLNWFMIRRFFYAREHLFGFEPRYMVRLLERTGFVVEKLISGGILLPGGRWTLPAPRPICYHMIYIARSD